VVVLRGNNEKWAVDMTLGGGGGGGGEEEKEEEEEEEGGGKEEEGGGRSTFMVIPSHLWMMVKDAILHGSDGDDGPLPPPLPSPLLLLSLTSSLPLSPPLSLCLCWLSVVFEGISYIFNVACEYDR